MSSQFQYQGYAAGSPDEVGAEQSAVPTIITEIPKRAKRLAAAILAGAFFFTDHVEAAPAVVDDPIIVYEIPAKLKRAPEGWFVPDLHVAVAAPVDSQTDVFASQPIRKRRPILDFIVPDYSQSDNGSPSVVTGQIQRRDRQEGTWLVDPNLHVEVAAPVDDGIARSIEFQSRKAKRISDQFVDPNLHDGGYQDAYIVAEIPFRLKKSPEGWIISDLHVAVPAVDDGHAIIEHPHVVYRRTLFNHAPYFFLSESELLGSQLFISTQGGAADTYTKGGEGEEG